jgi:hypothetical protein
MTPSDPARTPSKNVVKPVWNSGPRTTEATAASARCNVSRPDAPDAFAASISDLMIDAADLPMSASCRSVSIAPCTHRSKSPFSTLIDAHSWNFRAASSAPEVSLGSHCDPATPSVIRPSITGTIAPRKFPNAVAEFSKIAEI